MANFWSNVNTFLINFGDGEFFFGLLRVITISVSLGLIIACIFSKKVRKAFGF